MIGVSLNPETITPHTTKQFHMISLQTVETACGSLNTTDLDIVFMLDVVFVFSFGHFILQLRFLAVESL